MLLRVIHKPSKIGNAGKIWKRPQPERTYALRILPRPTGRNKVDPFPLL
jgi:hypothetical protein